MDPNMLNLTVEYPAQEFSLKGLKGKWTGNN